MDNELFWKLLKPVHPDAAAFCQRLARDYDEGNDLYQEGLMTAMRKLSTLKDTTTFRPWLFRILVNKYRNRCRSWWWQRRVQLSVEPTDGHSPQPQYKARRQLDLLLSKLSPADRAIVVLHGIEGWTLAELATMFRRPEGTIRTRFYRARRKMRESLKWRLPETRSIHCVGEDIYALHRSETADE